jgi:transposase InsO family protein
MSVRLAIAQADLAGLNVSEFCRVHGISRDRFYELRRRFEAEGQAGLEARSRAPRRVANRTPADVEDLIVELRKQLEDQGLDAGPASIWDRLASRLPRSATLPSEATIWRVLSRRGHVQVTPSKAPKRAWRRFSAERANECWQIDATHYPLADRTQIEIINVIDDCTRLCVASVAVASCSRASSFDTLTHAAGTWGWPERILSDNGPAFVALADTLDNLGIGLRHSRPYHPQTCGKVERFHQTLKRYLAPHAPFTTLTELQAVIDEFIDLYNQQRPHRSLDRETPAHRWHHTPKSGPAHLPANTPTNIHRVTIGHDGRAFVKGHYRISLGIAHARQPATIITTNRTTHVFVNGSLARQLTINPDTFDQPLHPRPGRPTTT